MAAIGAPRLGQRPLRAASSRAVLVLAHMGPRTLSRPTQAVCCLASICRSACSRQARRRNTTRGRQLAVRAVAMVNVDFASPSLLLGTALIGCGVLLLNLRNFQNKVSRDADIVVAAMVSIVGSTLIFQGWRLDPLLLLCQALTTSVAFWYGLETFRLRSKEADMAPPPLLPGAGTDPSSLDAQQQQYYYQQQQQQGGPGFPPPPPPGASFLPPGSEVPYYPWGASAPSEAYTSGREAPYGSSSLNNPYAETIQYDYYGNPILPQEDQQQQQQPPMYDSADPGYGNSSMSYGSSSSSAYGMGVGGMPPPSTSGADASLYGGQQQQAEAYGGSYAPSPSYQGGPYVSDAVGAGPGPTAGSEWGFASSSGGSAGGGLGGYGNDGQDAGMSYGTGTSYGMDMGSYSGPSQSFGVQAPSGSGGDDSGTMPSWSVPQQQPQGDVVSGASSSSWAGGLRSGASAGLGTGDGGGGRGLKGRLDLLEQVDDWE